MPTTQKSPQKHTKATQKVGGSAKKPVTKAMEGGSAKKPAVTKAMEGGKVEPSKGKMTRGGSAKGGALWNKKSTENAENIIELNNKISNIKKEDISNIKQDISNIKKEDISNIKQDISNIKRDITYLKSGLKLTKFYIKAILEKKFNTEEIQEITKIVSLQIEKDNTQTENKPFNGQSL
jgi:hypothetical protein